MPANSKDINIAMVGQGFMGRTHSNAWSQLGKFFPLESRCVMHSCYGRNTETVEAFCDKWGWQNPRSVKGKLSFDADIDLVDIVTPNNTHAKYAIAAMEAGKNVACEKPIADTLDTARQMSQMARKKKVKTYVWYNYRRCPAVALAHRLVKEGKIGRITRICAWYLQDWATPDVPLTWRFNKKLAGGGVIGDLTAHVVDMTRFVSGEEITEICGAASETYVKQRPLETEATTGQMASRAYGAAKAKMAKVTVDDTTIFIARFSGGAIGTFEACRQATGNQNRNGFEINGEKGAIRFNFEHMTELEYCDATGDAATKGWRTIICSHAGSHDYAEYWWPDAHPIGYEHSFTNMAWDITRDLSGKKPTLAIPDFEDAYQTQRVLTAAMLAAKEKTAIKLSQVK